MGYLCFHYQHRVVISLSEDEVHDLFASALTSFALAQSRTIVFLLLVRGNSYFAAVHDPFCSSQPLQFLLVRPLKSSLLHHSRVVTKCRV
jgi:hypothetical protein